MDMAANGHLFQSIHHEHFKPLQIHLLQDVDFVSLLQKAEVIYNHHSPAVVPRQLHSDCSVLGFNNIFVVYGRCHGIGVTGDESLPRHQLLLNPLAPAGLHAVLKDLLHKASLICVLGQPAITELLKHTCANNI